MPVSRLLNLIAAWDSNSEAVNDPDEWEDYTLVPPQEEEGNHSVCRDFAENTPTPVVAQSQSCRILSRGYLAHAPVRSHEPLHHEHG